jgi:hypothetical protein
MLQAVGERGLHIGKFNHKRADANAKEVHCGKMALNSWGELSAGRSVKNGS